MRSFVTAGMSLMSKQTIYNASHRALNAKMVDFGGWDMPIHYGSQIDELVKNANETIFYGKAKAADALREVSAKVNSLNK